MTWSELAIKAWRWLRVRPRATYTVNRTYDDREAVQWQGVPGREVRRLIWKGGEPQRWVYRLDHGQDGNWAVRERR